MTDLELMQSIKTNYGDVIAAAARTDFQPSFFAALIANESDGNPNAKRFEPHVLAALWEVLLGRTAAYGSIKTKDLVGFVSGVSNPVFVPKTLPADAFNRFDRLATSWGLTQIMGWHVFDTFGGAVTLDPQQLQDPATCLDRTANLLADFAHRFQLQTSIDSQYSEKLFRCWNTGTPEGKTFDPNYVANGVARMDLYVGLA